MRRERNCEPAPEYSGRYQHTRLDGVAWFVLGWETEPDEDTEWSGYENRTGRLVACMVGDDRLEAVDPDELKEIDYDSYCHECGQIGCTADGRSRR